MLRQLGTIMLAKHFHPQGKASGEKRATSSLEAEVKQRTGHLRKLAQAGETKSWNSVRPGEVARAKRLVQNEKYPSPRVVRAIADLLSRNWKETE